MDYLNTLKSKMLSDSWKESYINSLISAVQEIRNAGISEKLPKKLRLTGGSCCLLDERGQPFGKLRNRYGSCLTDEINEMLDYENEAVDDWLTGIGGDSWSTYGVKARLFWMNQRTLSSEEYYWRSPMTAKTALSSSQQNLYATWNMRDEKNAKRAWTVWHAYTLEILSNTEFPNNNRPNQSIRLLRTEVKEALRHKSNNRPLLINQPGVIKHSVLDPTSCFKMTSVSLPTGVTITEVPHHRVIAMYMQQPFSRKGAGAFKQDEENEFQAILEGLETKLLTSAPRPREERQICRQESPTNRIVNLWSQGSVNNKVDNKIVSQIDKYVGKY
ncbi:MAG: hypothetical protein GY750_04615 [Lentisphaerae bacterium]|nr:hypothetical protein [Lentisphaerota bacterium]MCP4100694.1 hypothetical protein [Lentisphaerota bacterium]